MKKEYIISPISTYDNHEELWYTKVGEDKKDMPLLLITVGKSKKKSRDLAEKIIELLSKNEPSTD